MPFITNDFDSMLVDDEDYEKHPEKYKYYVVARRLFVSSKTAFSDEYLHERFKKYGPIESSKILKTKTEAFVTFECDRHACLAYHWEKDKCAEKRVRVDSTWHQPDEGIIFLSEWNTYEDDDLLEGDESMDEPIDPEAPSPLLSLDDNSLCNLFDRCDHLSLVNLSMTCSRLEQLLKGGNYYFPNQKTFHIDLEDGNLSLIDANKVFRLMGRYFESLDLWFPADTSEMTVFSYIRIILKYCQVDRLKDMTFAMPSWNNKYFAQLTPIFKNLTKLFLTICDYNEEDVSALDFKELCPNLETIILWDICFVDKCFTKTIHTLESFCWKYSWSELMEGLDSFKFFEVNRQLKNFDCTDFNFEYLERTIELMPNAQNIVIYVPSYYSVSTNDILNLKNFKNLKKLTLGLVEHYSINREEIIECCGRLKNLLELTLYFPKLKNIPEPAIDISRKLWHLRSQLERLDLYGVQLNEKVIMDFVGVAANIKMIHLHECNVYATESLLMQLGCMAKSSQNYRGELKLFIGNDIQNNFVSINSRKIVSIDYICSHRYNRYD